MSSNLIRCFPKLALVPHIENHDIGIIIFIRKLLEYLPPSRNFIPKLLISPGTYRFTEFVEYRESILRGLTNLHRRNIGLLAQELVSGQ